jgi:hypothetical protein
MQSIFLHKMFFIDPPMSDEESDEKVELLYKGANKKKCKKIQSFSLNIIIC